MSEEQLRTDLIYLAKRLKVIEDAVIRLENALLGFSHNTDEWSEFMIIQLLQQGTRMHKNETSTKYFKESMKDKFKTDYDKFETLFSKIKKHPSRKEGKPKGIVEL